MLFILPKKFLSFWRDLYVCSDFFDYVRKQLDKKTKINIKIYDASNWKKNNYNRHISQHLKKARQSVDEIWSVIKM